MEPRPHTCWVTQTPKLEARAAKGSRQLYRNTAGTKPHHFNYHKLMRIELQQIQYTGSHPIPRVKTKYSHSCGPFLLTPQEN